jgi:hypothetical protein
VSHYPRPSRLLTRLIASQRLVSMISVSYLRSDFKAIGRFRLLFNALNLSLSNGSRRRCDLHPRIPGWPASRPAKAPGFQRLPAADRFRKDSAFVFKHRTCAPIAPQMPLSSDPGDGARRRRCRPDGRSKPVAGAGPRRVMLRVPSQT